MYVCVCVCVCVYIYIYSRHCSVLVLLNHHQNQNVTVSTLFLNKSPFSNWITYCQFLYTNCRITIHYFLTYIYIYIYIQRERERERERELLLSISKIYNKLKIWLIFTSYVKYMVGKCLFILSIIISKSFLSEYIRNYISESIGKQISC